MRAGMVCGPVAFARQVYGGGVEWVNDAAEVRAGAAAALQPTRAGARDYQWAARSSRWVGWLVDLRSRGKERAEG